jgi:hypothetical protein
MSRSWGRPKEAQVIAGTVSHCRTLNNNLAICEVHAVRLYMQRKAYGAAAYRAVNAGVIIYWGEDSD